MMQIPRLLSRWPVAIVLLVLTGCSGEITGSDGGAAFYVADEEAIVLRLDSRTESIEGEIPLRLTNRTDRQFVVSTCRGQYGVALQRWDGTAWEAVYSSFLWDCLGPPIVIASGEVFEDTFQFFALVGESPYRFPANEGRYRLMIFPQWDAGMGDGRLADVPLEYRVSNEFRIRIEEVPQAP